MLLGSAILKVMLPVNNRCYTLVDLMPTNHTFPSNES